MKPSDPLYSELVSLISMRLEEREAPEAADRLELLLTTNSDACELYIALADLHATLLWEAAPSDSCFRDALQYVEPVAELDKVIASSIPVATCPGRTRRSLGLSVACSILGVAVLFYGTFAMLSWNLRSAALPIGTDGNDLVVGTIHNEIGVVWGTERRAHQPDEGRPQAANDICRHELLQIETGIVELHLVDGATLLIEGPAEWSLDSSNRATLRAGTAVAYVPPRASGFTLDTPTAQIVDRGTEFGVQVHHTGKTDVAVLKGCVEVEPNVPGEETVFDSIRLIGGQSVCIEPGEHVAERGNIDTAQFNRLSASRSIPPSDQVDSPDFREIPLGNLFDDPREILLADALKTNEFTATADIDDLGVERALYGGESIRRIAPSVDLDLSALGWSERGHSEAANDGLNAPIENSNDFLQIGMRTEGRAMPRTLKRIEEGIGMSANSLVTFDLGEIRRAGGLTQESMRFVSERVGINDDVLGEDLPSAIAVAVLCDSRGVPTVFVNGNHTEIKRGDDAWLIAGRIASPLRADGNVARFNIAIAPTDRYLTLIVSCAGDRIDGDAILWTDARLQIEQPSGASADD